MDYSGWILAALIILPILLVGLVAGSFLWAVILKETGKRESLGNIISLNPNYGLAKQLLFWLSIVTPIIYFFAFGLFAWQGHSVSLTKSGFDTFIELSKMPFALASLSIPMTALVAKLHSTAQTAKQIGLASRQIKIAETKNNHDLFYSHRKEFVSFYDVVGELVWLDEFRTAYKIDPRIHARLFKGEPATGIPVLKYEYVDHAITKLRSAETLLSKIIMHDEPRLDDAHTSFVDFSRDMFYLIRLFGIKDLSEQIIKCSIYMPYSDVKGQRHYQACAGTSTQQAVAIYRCVKSYLLSAVEFAGYHEGIEKVQQNPIPYIAMHTGYEFLNPKGLIIEKIINNFGA